MKNCTVCHNIPATYTHKIVDIVEVLPPTGQFLFTAIHALEVKFKDSCATLDVVVNDVESVQVSNGYVRLGPASNVFDLLFVLQPSIAGKIMTSA